MAMDKLKSHWELLTDYADYEEYSVWKFKLDLIAVYAHMHTDPKKESLPLALIHLSALKAKQEYLLGMHPDKALETLSLPLALVEGEAREYLCAEERKKLSIGWIKTNSEFRGYIEEIFLHGKK